MARSSGREPARARLAELMDQRRRDLRLTWDHVASQAGIHRETLRQIRIGSGDIRPLSATGIEDALQWERGSIETILAGGEPTATSSEQARTMSWIAEDPDVDPDEARLWAISELSPDERQILIVYLREKKRAIAEARREEKGSA